VTSVIGREFPKVQLTDILKDDAKIRDLAITGMSCSLSYPKFRHQFLFVKFVKVSSN
jgi:hypothetical protein